MIRAHAVALLVLLLLPSAAQAWSNPGHRLVGELAQRHLTPAAAAEVSKLLADEPEPTLAGVASWADELRKSSPEAYQRTQAWHYVNYRPGTCAYQPQRDCPDGNCVPGQIEAQRAILADRKRTPAERSEALKFLVHFVGDAHQPLHNSNRRDKGGNDFQVSLRTDLPPTAALAKHYVDGVMGTNLHSVWDYYILASEGLTGEQYADRLDALPWPPDGMDASRDPADWSMESCRLIDADRLYPKSHRMEARYLDAQRPLAERRIRVAARRLSDLLNATLAP